MDDISDVVNTVKQEEPDEPVEAPEEAEPADPIDTLAAELETLNMLERMKTETLDDTSQFVEKRLKLDVREHLEEEEDKMENIMVHTIKVDNTNCTHEVAIPPTCEFEPLRKASSDPAKLYPFQLDAFQKQAILCIENNQSVLVSAHTSAGKTVVATYAIAQCLRDKQRVIYTSPIKALSNQKYRELEKEFKDVGLMTGDVTINPDASCLVMTTEILRSMLFRGSEIIKEVGWVVYDEINYMRDEERGVVWEETIILMSKKVKQAFLSATIPNARKFAQWVALIKKQPVNVVYTDYRPTPLQHFIYPVGGEGIYEVVNVRGEFREDKFKDAMSGLATAGDSAGNFQRRRTGGTHGDSNVLKIIRSVAANEGLNCIVFSFSRKECEAYAISLKDLDFNKDREKAMVKSVYESAIAQLSPEDQQLPQIVNILPLLKRGIGVHHSGLMPILKETIEILFGEGLVKVLFATETFSMGLNMPARTVVFTSARKFDGTDNRYITSGEYIQMAGRAGRRGKDTQGIVILMVDSAMASEDAKNIIKIETPRVGGDPEVIDADDGDDAELAPPPVPFFADHQPQPLPLPLAPTPTVQTLVPLPDATTLLGPRRDPELTYAEAASRNLKIFEQEAVKRDPTRPSSIHEFYRVIGLIHPVPSSVPQQQAQAQQQQLQGQAHRSPGGDEMPQRWPCAICGKHLKTRKIRNSHEKLHEQKDKFPCRFCPSTFTRQRQMKKHLREKHGQDDRSGSTSVRL